MYASAYRSLAAVAGGLVQARLRLLHNNTAGALDALREAAAVENGLGYMEPPRWAGAETEPRLLLLQCMCGSGWIPALLFVDSVCVAHVAVLLMLLLLQGAPACAPVPGLAAAACRAAG
jgi:hypothetical protein